MSIGKVYLVGAGPGDPNLITVRGLRLLRSADVVAHDRLVDPRLLRRAAEGGRVIDVGKIPRGGGGAAQDRINALLIAEAKRGNMVVRLKGGDPFVFGRGGEEARALRAGGVPFEIVPGVTSAIAAPAFAGIPLTQRGVSSSFTVFSGSRAADGGGADSTDWRALAQAPGTLVALMAWRNLDEIADNLIAAGKSPQTPAAVVSMGSRAEQKTASAPLVSIAQAAQARGLSSPAVLVVGDVARLRDELDWFETLPLFGRRVLVTRAAEQAGGLSERLASLGAHPVEIPTIRAVPLADNPELDAALADLGRFDWIAFSSANAVRAVFDRLSAAGADSRALHSVRVAAIGSATASALAARGISADFVPERSGSDGFADGLARLGVSGARILLPRSDIAGGALPERLRQSGAVVSEIAAYRTETPESSRAPLAAALDGGLDAATFASASAVSNLIALLDGDISRLDGVAIACIGRATAAAASELGLKVDIVSSVPSADALARELAARLAPNARPIK